MSETNCRPFIHYTPPFGWMNDPNGLVWHDGVYELYYQSNPSGLYWANMSWGHARSRDLLHWENLGTVLVPDETGMMFSGSGILSRPGDANEADACLCFPYTAAGSAAPESAAAKDEPSPGMFRPHFTIRLAKSHDGGLTLEKTGKEILPPYAPDNRDPKIFYHEESGAYIIVLWLAGDLFGIYRSEDLTDFTLASTVSLSGGFECPDLFCLPVYGADGQPTGERSWVFWAADGSFYVGDFDGYRFTGTAPRAKSCLSALPYAAQTFSGDPAGRIISLSWLRTMTIADTYTGAMSLPWELSLVKTPAGCMLRRTLPEEILAAAVPVPVAGRETALPEDGAVLIRTPVTPGLSFALTGDGGKEVFSVREEDGQVFLSSLGAGEYVNVYGKHLPTEIELIYDRGIIELTAAGGPLYTALDFPHLRTEKLTGVRWNAGPGQQPSLLLLR